MTLVDLDLDLDLIYNRVSSTNFTDFLFFAWDRVTKISKKSPGSSKETRADRYNSTGITFWKCLVFLLTLMSIYSVVVAESEGLKEAVPSSSKFLAVKEFTHSPAEAKLDRVSVRSIPDRSMSQVEEQAEKENLEIKKLLQAFNFDSTSWEHSQGFILQIFRRYKYNASHEKSLSINNFEAFMFQIGLGRKNDNLLNSTERNYDDGTFEEDQHYNLNHDIKNRTEADEDTSQVKLPAGVLRDKRSSSNSGNKSRQFHGKAIDGSHNLKNKCLSAEELLKAFNFENKTNLSQSNFLFLCPAILSQLKGEYCRKATLDVDRIQKALKSHDDDHDHDHEQLSATTGVKEWVYTMVAVIIISACSVLGVLILPHMDRVFYNHVLQFMVALATGAMSGDALLHLLPHAVYPHHHIEHAGHEEEDHDSQHAEHMVALYKGLVALVFIYLFFFIERLFTVFTLSSHHKKLKKNKSRILSKKEAFKSATFLTELNLADGQEQACDETIMVIHPNRALKSYADNTHESSLQCDGALLSSPINPGRQDASEVSVDVEETDGRGDTSIAGNDQMVHSDSIEHSHTHSHLSGDLNGFSSIAVMVIAGDAIHNFFDGVAIGAAFAGNVAQGLSTSLAVFCHELPHELGDIAVLLRSGLSVRRAVYWNLMSCIPCFIGAVAGLLLGHVSFATSWIFAAVAGMFLYIALVDLVSEMNAVYTKQDEPWYLHLLLQACGMTVGATIMLILGVYERVLLTAFKD